MKKPRTLQQAILHFANPDNCLKFMVARRWPSGIECPTCGRDDVRFISTRRMWECKGDHTRKQFSVKVGTIFEDSALPLDKWLIAIWMVANCKNGVSSYEVGRALGITQKSAWFMLHRIRLAMQCQPMTGLLKGQVQVDETYVGGKIRIGQSRRSPVENKTPVVALVETGGKVRSSKLRPARSISIFLSRPSSTAANSTASGTEDSVSCDDAAPTTLTSLLSTSPLF